MAHEEIDDNELARVVAYTAIRGGLPEIMKLMEQYGIEWGGQLEMERRPQFVEDLKKIADQVKDRPPKEDG